MARAWLSAIGLSLLAALVAACQYAAGDLAVQTAAPAPPDELREVISADVSSCEPQTLSGDSMVKTIFGSNLLTLTVVGASGDDCRFDFTNEVGTGYYRYSCRVPKSLGRVVVYEFDKGVTDIHGYRYGHQFSWDLNLCTVGECSEGTIIPSDCSRR